MLVNYQDAAVICIAIFGFFGGWTMALYLFFDYLQHSFLGTFLEFSQKSFSNFQLAKIREISEKFWGEIDQEFSLTFQCGGSGRHFVPQFSRFVFLCSHGSTLFLATDDFGFFMAAFSREKTKSIAK
jgi:hypothetical protein